jgi:hypothetical protein
LIVPALLTCCVTSVDLIQVARNMAERRRGPKPESEWNESGIWQRVADNPATYIPKGYPKSALRGEKEGTWIVDERDGKKLFVPNVNADGYEPGVLLGEAAKITSWHARQTIFTRPGVLVMP